MPIGLGSKNRLQMVELTRLERPHQLPPLLIAFWTDVILSFFQRCGHPKRVQTKPNSRISLTDEVTVS